MEALLSDDQFNTLTKVEYLTTGYENDVLINHEYGLVLRIPKHDRAVLKLLDEPAIYQMLQDRNLSLPTPALLATSPDFSLALYNQLPGQPLDEHINAIDIQATGQQIGQFLAELHAIPPEQLERHGWKNNITMMEWYEGLIEKTTPVDIAHAGLQQLARSYFTQLLASQPPEPRNVVTHGDLHGGNILVDVATSKVTGVIDFSEAEHGYPHQEFRKLLMLNPELCQVAIDQYNLTSQVKVDMHTVQLWSYVNELANLCRFYADPENKTHERALRHLRGWGFNL